MAGPAIRAGVRLESPHVLDVAPTLLYLQGLPLAEDMPGRLLSEAIRGVQITVGPPFEVAVYDRDTMALRHRCKFDERNPYLVQLRETWNEGVRAAFSQLPLFDWEKQSDDVSTKPCSVSG